MIVVLLFLAFGIAEIVCRFHDRRMTRWQARVVWECDTYIHPARSEQEAREWAACYPAHAWVRIEHLFHGHRSFIAQRGAA